jgi:ubiquinone/menaquinone biosynthesis C-methylase UbiE
MITMQSGYDRKLANEWMKWVEEPNPDGTREREMFPLIRKWVEKLKPKVMVDLGCGQGSCSELVDNKIRYIGIDSSPTLIRRAERLHSSPNRKFIQGDVCHTPLEGCSADAALSVWVWSHLDNLEQAAKEMHRILNKKGRFLIITANPETYGERKTFYKRYDVKGKLLTGTFDLGNGKVLTDTTLYLHSKEEIEGSVKQVGLKISRVRRIGQSKSSDKGLYLAIEGSK